jgi:hypothetical protein
MQYGAFPEGCTTVCEAADHDRVEGGSKFKVHVENNEVVTQIVDENEGSLANN